MEDARHQKDEEEDSGSNDGGDRGDGLVTVDTPPFLHADRVKRLHLRRGVGSKMKVAIQLTLLTAKWGTTRKVAVVTPR